jgi:prepilin-type processing-associated H-X9-DG protein
MKMQNRNQIQFTDRVEPGEPIPAGACGFTRLDLLAIVAVVGLLSLILLPAIAKPGLNSKTIQCLNNNRQLQNAWRIYADDNGDALVFASTGCNTARSGGSTPYDTVNPIDPNNFAWSGAHMDYNGANRANWDPNYDMQKRPLWPYTARNTSIYKCPSDQSAVSFLGVVRPRILSMNMNLYVGGFAPTSGSVGTDCSWPFAAPQRIFSSISSINVPSKIFVFLDMRPDAVDWSNFMQDMIGYSPNNPASYSFTDVPGDLHDGAATFSFADGHTEVHRWTDPRTTPSFLPSPGQILNVGSSPNNPDVYWLQDHSTHAK